MRGKKTRSFAAIAWLLAMIMVLLWMVCMGCITWLQAQHYLAEVQNGSYAPAGELIINNQLDDYYRYEEWDQQMTQSMLRVLEGRLVRMVADSNDGPYRNGIGDDVHMKGAAILYDPQGRRVFWNRDVLLCQYVSEEHWHAGTEPTDGNLWIDLEKYPLLMEKLQQFGEKNSYSYKSGFLRLNGSVSGQEFRPFRAEFGEYTGKGFHGVPEFVTLLEEPPQAGEESITVYAHYLEIIEFEENSQVRYSGKSYENTLALLEAIETAQKQDSLLEYVEFDSNRLTVPDSLGNAEFYNVSTVMVCYPLRGAAEALLGVYIGTFVLLVVLVGIVLVIVHRNLIHPLKVLDAGFFGMVRSRRSWAEPEMLAQQLEKMDEKIKERNDQLRKKDNEIFRLDQSVDFVRKNEENRRQMVSGIAHELKTPLAIISGYTEGLQEHIAEEKREEYLEIILSETRRMDGLVMEMLELSRLEAGKITLARDEFDLSAMIRDVFAKLGREAEQKGLRVELELRFDTPVYADEGRIEQIIRNLASNAVRYTPEGGCIRVSTERLLGNVEVRIYNDAQPFSEEELQKVWEVFYRTDSARQGKGTGLGLTITKNLVKLHGGSCSVRNAPGGVEFSFRIPQKYGANS